MAKKKTPMRSKFETNVAAWLTEKGVAFEYEEETFEYYVPVRGGRCIHCNHTTTEKSHWYTPDFFLDNGVIIEAKGKFAQADRRKVERTIKEHGVDIRMLFLRDNLIGRKQFTSTRYSDWCDKRGIKWSLWPEDKIPEDWLD
jgi:hypothetical protein